MKKFWWRFRLFVLMTRFGYVPRRRHNFIQTWKWTGEECWIDYFNDGYSPVHALQEDWSYA